jgi:hypothetical protein
MIELFTILTSSPQSSIIMNIKKKFGNIKLEAIQELNKTQQKAIQGGGPNSPCCPTSPYYSASACKAYSGCANNFTGSYAWCGTVIGAGAGVYNTSVCW